MQPQAGSCRSSCLSTDWAIISYGRSGKVISCFGGCWCGNDGNNQASPSPLFGSNANVAAALPNPLPPDGDDQDNNKTSRSGFDKNQSAKDAKRISSNDEADEFARSKGYENAHDLKKEYVGKKNISRFDIYRNNKTGEAFLIKNQNPKIIIPITE